MRADTPTNETILVATDFSEPSARATETAAALARRMDAHICLVHVFQPPSVLIPEGALEPRVDEEMRQWAADQLSVAASALRAEGLKVEERLRIGVPGETIAEVASELDPALVVMGSHGRRALSRLVLGSVAERALAQIKQPVMIVPSHASVATSPSPEWTPSSLAQRWCIAVGLDLSHSAAAAVEWVRTLRRRFECDVVFIHLYWPATEYARFGLSGPRDLFEPDETTVALLKKSLAPAIGNLPGRGDVTLRVLPNWGAPGPRLVDEAKDAKADLLVLGTHHRHGFSRLLHGSTVPPALHAGGLPIVCVSPQKPGQPGERPVPHLRNILVATDLSDFGNRAIPYGYALAEGERGVVHLLYVHERGLPVPAYAYAPDNDGGLTPGQAADINARLHAQIPAQAASLGVATEVLLVDGGTAAEAICQTAERLGVDAIALGSHGRSGIGRLALGSVAERVLHTATRPVLVVRSGPES